MHCVVVRRYSPVFVGVVLLWVVFLVESEKGVELDALLEVSDCLKATDVLHEVKVAEGVDTSFDHSVPVDTLELDVGVILLELEVERLAEVDVWSLDGKHILFRHLKLTEIEVLWEHFHFVIIY